MSKTENPEVQPKPTCRRFTAAGGAHPQNHLMDDDVLGEQALPAKEAGSTLRVEGVTTAV